jgi:CheY-like chemotaxis protein
MLDGVGSMRVLVVEDNEDAAATMAILLKHCGHIAHLAGDGETALQQAPLLKPDLMFIDLAMPKLDGLAVARLLRKLPECSGTPLIAVSGFVDSEHRARASAAGFDDFLAKPYPLSELLETLGRVQAKVLKARQGSDGAVPPAAGLHVSPASSDGHTDERRRTPEKIPAEPVPFSIEKSGISDLVALATRAAAEELRGWLKNQRCRVGPIFKPSDEAEEFGFFVYSRRHALPDLVMKNTRFKLLRPSRSGTCR